MLFVCYTPKFPENPEPNRTNRDLGRSCSVSSRSIGCSSRFGLGLGREVKNLIGIGLNPRTDTEHRAVSVHSQACEWNRKRVLEYLNKKKRFLELLMLAMFIMGGQSARDLELGSIKFRDSVLTRRNFFVIGGHGFYVTEYNKARACTNQ